jgi:hypothetical protein
MDTRSVAIILALLAVVAVTVLVVRGARGQASQDAQVIEQLKNAGSDLSKPHPIDFFLYLPTEESANRTAETLRGLGYEIKRVDRAATGSGWLVLASRTFVPTESALLQSGQELESSAKSNGGTYDGWEAPVIK